MLIIYRVIAVKLMTMAKLYELRIDSAKMSNMAKALEINAGVLPDLKTKCPPLGCFTTDIGNLNRFIHFYEYGMCNTRLRCRTVYQDCFGEAFKITEIEHVLGFT